MTFINTTKKEDVYLDYLEQAYMIPDWMHAMLTRMDNEIESLKSDLEILRLESKSEDYDA